MLSNDVTVWVVEAVNINGEASRAILASPEEVGNFVRVNANDAVRFQISQTDAGTLASYRITETFDVA